jgi:hypothetical protein
MKIAIYTHSIAPSIDGVCRRFTAILCELVRQKHEVLLFTLEKAPEDIPPEVKWTTIFHLVFPAYPGKKVAFPTITTLISIHKELVAFKPDVCRCRSFFLFFF